MCPDNPPPAQRTELAKVTASILNTYFEGLKTNDASDIPFAEDVILENPRTRPDGEPLRGRDGVVEFFERAAESMPHVEVERHVVEGEIACSLVEWESSEGVNVPTVVYFEIIDGTISKVGIYFDRAVVTEE